MAKQREYTVAILGATGAVGQRMIEQLAASPLAVKELRLLASTRSAGQTRDFRGQPLTVQEARPESFDGVDLVLASAGGAASKQFLPAAVKRGAVCVDNTAAFRMDPEVPLVVPEVNPEVLAKHHGIIANPNCSTIQMVVALAPLKEQFGLNKIVVSTYQAASGAGQQALNELYRESEAILAGQEPEAKILPTKGDRHHYPLAFNLLPQIDVFEADGYSHEEWKMIHETKKIMLGDMDAPELKVTATCVRVPVPIGHGEEVYFQLADGDVTADDLRRVLAAAPGVVVQDDPKNQLYPQPRTAVGKREVFVGRIRPDVEARGSFHLWVVADNLLKGAAYNAVQNAVALDERGLI